VWEWAKTIGKAPIKDSTPANSTYADTISQMNIVAPGTPAKDGAKSTPATPESKADPAPAPAGATPAPPAPVQQPAPAPVHRPMERPQAANPPAPPQEPESDPLWYFMVAIVLAIVALLAKKMLKVA
jgi:hypothetical protein